MPDHFCGFFLLAVISFPVHARDLHDIKDEGVLRHLGVPYANFVINSNEGLDVELIQLFAAYLGVEYRFVPTSWGGVLNDLTGKTFSIKGSDVTITGESEIKGDLIANGLTILPWRQQLVTYSTPTFPTQVWLISGAGSALNPIIPSGSIEEDIDVVKKLLMSKTVLGVPGTCLDHTLYDVDQAGGESVVFRGNLNELAPAVMEGAADTALLDVADSLMALKKWPGQIKILGPVSVQQEMGVGFRKDSPELHAAFETFYKQLREAGTYMKLVEKYYPDVFDYYPDFF